MNRKLYQKIKDYMQRDDRVTGINIKRDVLEVDIEDTTIQFSVTSTIKEIFIMHGRGYCISSFLDFDGTWFANVSGMVHKQSFQGETEVDVVEKAAVWCIEIEEEYLEIKKNAELQLQYGEE